MQSVKDDSSSQMSEITNRVRQTVSLNAPKSERTSQHQMESLFGVCMYMHKPVAKPPESTWVVRGRGAVMLQMSSQTFPEKCTGKVQKTSEPCQ